MHLNIRILLPGLDYVKIWAMQVNPLILVLTETWISGDVLDFSDINIEGCDVLGDDRVELVVRPFFFKIISLSLY